MLAGVLGLALLEAALSSDAATGRVGQLLNGVATVVSHVLSPAVPAIPDLRHRSSGGASAVQAAAPSPGSSSTPDQTGGSKTFPADWTTSPTALFV